MTPEQTPDAASMRWPDFYVVGAPKCGTTSLFYYLRQHPEVFLPDAKEPHYFGSDLTWRHRLVPREAYASLYADVPDNQLAGDMSVFYLMSHDAAREIHEVRPDGKIVVVVRDPLKMLPSLHRMTLKTGVETLTDLRQAIEAEPQRRMNGTEVNSSNPGLEQAVFYSEAARYAEQIERYFSQFGRQNVHVILFEDFAENTTGEFARLCDFLGIDRNFDPVIAVHNVGLTIKRSWLWRFTKHPPEWLRAFWRRLLPGRVRSRMLRAAERVYSKPGGRDDLSDELKLDIRAMYDEDVKRLEALIGRDLSRWLGGASVR